jgi:hypothetical protein
MLGWHISVYRQADGGRKPATSASSRAARLAVWQTGVGDLDWLEELVRSGEAIGLGGSGYPCWYTAKALAILNRALPSPPGARSAWASDPGDILTDGWEGHTVIDDTAVQSTSPDEWLLIEWDES